MGSTQGEIRVGPSHQAKLPENRLTSNAVELSPDPEFSKDREETRWVPSVMLDGDLVMYLRAARSMAAFAGMCDGGSAEDGCIAARRDGTTINAMDVLHDCSYDQSKALQTLVKCPVPKCIEKKWTEEETKRFVKGLRQFGKNFFRIKKDLLPHKDTPELVEFYYLWKKTPGANNNRPHRRRRQGSLRRNRNTRNTRGGTPKEEVSSNSSRPSPSSKDQGEASSGSDDDNDNSYDDSDSRENGGYRCQHCFTTNSRDWLHAPNGPKQGALLCYNCRTYYKQYGELPPTPRNETYLFQPVQNDSPEGSPARMRTRNKAKETPTKERSSKAKPSEATTPEPETDKKAFNNNTSDCKSPGSVVSSPGDKSKKKGKPEPISNRKRTNILQNEGETKRKREHGPDSASGESDCESLLDEIDASSPTQNTEEKPKSETPTAPPLLPIAELTRQAENVDAKGDNTDTMLPLSVIYQPPSTSPAVTRDCTDKVNLNVDENSTENISTSKPFESTKENDFGLPVMNNAHLPMPLSKPFDYEVSVNNVFKTEVMFGSSSADRDEILPPVLTSEESYVPKDEMPTLHANTNISDTVTTGSPYSTDLKYPSNYAPSMEMPVDTIKMEPGLQSSDENSMLEAAQKPNRPDSPMQRSTSPTPFPTRQTISPTVSLPYPQIPSESPRAVDSSSDKTLTGPPIMLPGYAMYNENERSEKGISSSGVPPVSLNLSQHHSAFPPYYHFPPHPSHSDKNEPSPYLGSNALQMEPQDLKIKQEVLPLDQQRPPSVDPLQSLKEVKVPGYSNTSISQPLLPTTTTSAISLSGIESHSISNRSDTNSPFMPNMQVEDIKKESEAYNSTRAVTPLKSPNLGASKISSEVPRPLSPKLSHTPPYQSIGQPLTTQHSSTRTPSSSPLNTSSGSVVHSGQQSSPLSRASPAHLAHPHAYMPPIHPHQHYFHNPLFASAAAAQVAHAMHYPHPHNPYTTYPYPFPYPYSIPQPIPPPRPLENQKREVESATTLLTSHHSSSSSSSVTTRSLRDEDSNIHAQEITQTHHHSSSHHSSIHHHNEKQTISHSSSSSSSASVQHKVKRSSSPQHSSSTCHVSATLSQSTSSSVSTNHGQSTHHSHHHQHTHHHQSASGESPSQLMNMPIPIGCSSSRNGNSNSNLNVSQNKSHSSSMLTGPGPVLSAHHSALSLSALPPPQSPAGSLEALRAHAHASTIHPSLLQPSPHGLGHGGYLGPANMTLPGNSDLVKPDPSLVQANDDSLLGPPDDDELPSPTNHIPKGPSPEPKVEDSECHRSQSAIFLRHWNRGDYNSCARTDLTFKPVPDSQLDRKRQERIRKQAEKEREEREKNQARKITTPDKPETAKPPSRGPIETITSPYDRFARGTPYGESSAIRELREFARPHGTFSPVGMPRSAASLAIGPQCIDPMMHYQLNQLNMYGPMPRDRLELEQFEREKQFRELRDKELNERIKEEMIKNATGARLQNPVDPHWLDLQRRFNHPLTPGSGALHPFGLYAAGQPTTLSPLERERLERLASAAGPYSRPGILSGREASMGLHHASEILVRPYADQLAQQAAAHEHIQRQMMLERERYSHPALVAAQHEEYLRQQKIRTLEEAARASRP